MSDGKVQVEGNWREAVIELDNVKSKRLRGEIERISVGLDNRFHEAGAYSDTFVRVEGHFQVKVGGMDAVTLDIDLNPEDALKVLDKWLTEDQREMLDKACGPNDICNDCYSKLHAELHGH